MEIIEYIKCLKYLSVIPVCSIWLNDSAFWISMQIQLKLCTVRVMD